MRPIDETGNKYGRLTVLEHIDVPGSRLWRWQCLCECGNLTKVSGSSLRSGKVLSCGCLRAESNRSHFQDLTGQRFGKLVALERVNEERRGFLWKCQCECGKLAEVKSYSLLNGHTRSCGCLVSGGVLVRNLNAGEAQVRDIFRGYVTSAKRRDLPWALSLDQLRELVLRPCHYCGAPPSNLQKGSRGNSRKSLLYNGIDRRDNKQGYLSDNVVTCCPRCNWAKQDASEEVFLSWLEALVAYRISIARG